MTDTTYAKGSWQHNLAESSTMLDRSAKAKKRAGLLLWTGATTAINEWLPKVDDDEGAEEFASEVLEALGTSRKGDASKIKTVALAVAHNGLLLDNFDNLSKAYAEATRLRKTVAEERTQDEAAEAAIEAIEAPKTTSSIDGAAALLFSKGLDGAVVAILDTLGATNFDAHRAFVRAVSGEVASRVQAAKPKPEPKAKAEPKEGTAKATKAKAPKAAATKAKPKPKPAEAEAEPETDDLDALLDEDTAAEVEAPVEETKAKAPAARRARPVRRRG